LALISVLGSAHAEKRVALVIGNDRYANLPTHEQLQKAVNDARAVGEALKSIGFEVIPGENLDRRALVGRLNELTTRVASGDMGFFFFSGHGVALDGVNYILPTDVPDIAAGQETLLKGEALSEQYVVTELTGRGVRVAVVVLDACRTNPFTRSGGKGIGFAKGLAPSPQVQGVFSLYAASSGQAALDRLSDRDPNPNSVFTRVLIPALTRPGVDLTALAFDVREEVARIAKQAGYEQRPAYYDETIGGRVYLAGSALVTPAGAAAPATQQVAVVAPPVIPAVPAADPCGGPVAASFPDQCHAPLTAAQERGLKPKDSFRECENCPEVVVVPAGSFAMGSPETEQGRSSDEGPQHVVTIGRPFAVGKLHVTVDQFVAFLAENGVTSKYAADCQHVAWRYGDFNFVKDGPHPAVCLSWEDAQAYVEWLAKKTHKPYRMLTEAEWEYAARGQTQPGIYPRFWFGDDEKGLCRYGNVFDLPIATRLNWQRLGADCSDGYAYTSPAGHYQPNAFGLYDMFGNAWQWTADCYHDSYKGAPASGSAWLDGNCSGHVLRGSSWFGFPKSFRSAMRSWGSAEARKDDLGFRVARTLAP
jgi:formylglycine-generating enzyme required for sulfatase activity